MAYTNGGDAAVLNSLEQTNFKSIGETARLDLPLLSVVVGCNSAGKSSLFQGALLMKQMLDDGVLGIPVPLNGSHVQLGAHDNLMHRPRHTSGANVEMKLGFYLPGPRSSGAQTNGSECELCVALAPTTRGDTRLERVQITRDGSPLCTVSRTDPRTVVLALATDGGGAAWEAEIPSTEFLLSDVWNGMLYRHSFRDKPGAQSVATNERLWTLGRVGRAFSTELSRLTYIGPDRLRTPRVALAPSHRTTIGPHGEYALDILLRNPKKILPRVADWLQRLDMAADLEFSTNTAFGVYRVDTVDPQLGIKVPVSDNGFGMSQVLPMLVHGLSARVKSTTIVEQPEVHLHPKAQVVMGDFFVEVANSGRQMILETHSEHMVLSIQRNIVEGRIRPADVAFYVVDKSAGGTRVSRVVPDDRSLIPWPKGFFDEYLNQQFKIVSAAQRRR